MVETIEILADKAALVARARSLVLEKATAAIAARGQFTIALAGGSTPQPLYEHLATEALPWEKIHVFWGDERYVAPDDPESNQRMARQAWLARVPFPPENIHPMPTEGGDPAIDAAAHEAQLQAFFRVGAGEFPAIDLILLGIGDDGHTASLFPHTAALGVRDRLITVGNKGENPRLTFTVPFLNAARCILVLVAGENKRSALANILAIEGDANQYPARLIRDCQELYWLLDRAAGSDFE